MNDNHPAGHGPTRAVTVADVLALPVLAAGQPQVVTGVPQLDRPVRWVHITELTDPASFLKGGELVLTTGMPLPDDVAGVRRYVDELAGIGAAALVIELVRRYHRPPDALVDACRLRGLPLVTLAKDVNFLEVTQVVHALLLGNQADAMRRTQRIHEVFTALTLRGAGPEDVVRAAAEMCGRTVVLENLVHQALICEPSGGTVEEALTGWEQRSRADGADGADDHTATYGPGGWLTAPVEYQGERWGRVVMLPARTDGPAFGPEDITVLERTAMALTVARLIHSTPWERTAHRNALRDLVDQRHRSAEDARARCAALGLPTDRSRFVATLVDLRTGRGGTEPESRLFQELRTAGIPALVGELSPDRLGILLALRPSQPWRPVVERLCSTALSLAPQAVVSVGSEITDLSDAVRSFREAARVAEATPPGQPLPPDRSFHELSDIGLRRLLYALREDTRIQEYAEQQLGRLIDHDSQHGTDLLTTLRHYLEAAGNKTTAARRGGLSRETMYQRLRTIERLLDRDLESGEQRTELHAALTALDVLRAH
ncbi:PucR family transcriptional regulator [Streptomyces europaeiscabiei]|uniref:PucR family transcriptional regulator ligand-binding domain-containing protein n=1 Tax=Streptomyces europaeiscabiei TaxID=146819 RepID=A0ABU4NRS7_9ACTN|nr:PucR family transcriptional regulator [Streptomyces europaeiscabiei]MDX2526151.1 PucR family transcriptional regulator ligand-binding domain-containing protein [Streptomyces europaeiscabiei]MDX2759364.1 PucR family transcriptional regulator ligand-binding domain-containing protein [Streptomyces europaeiscabiei]MDX2767522.1 PucR family transcriptional regulator ligand-binding domain-containing protein [Streptomyces europaeiscabiei]MDX3547589.1 PucR family transcriptional regulator ligand-bind